MLTEDPTELFLQFYRQYYQQEIGELAQNYPDRQRSLYIDYDDLSTFDMELAEDIVRNPEAALEYAEEALRIYDLPASVQIGRAHVRVINLPGTVSMSEIRFQDGCVGRLIAIEGTVRESKSVEPRLVEAAFECQICGVLNYVYQADADFQDPHECQGCERKGPFNLVTEQSEFVDARTIRLIEHPTNLSDRKTPEEIEVQFEDDLVDEVAAGQKIRLNGVLRVDQENSNNGDPSYAYRIDPISVEDPHQEEPRRGNDRAQIPDLDTYTELAATALTTLPKQAREEETKAKLITPFIEALGWNKFDSTEVRMEYTDTRTSLRVDYALFGPDSDTPQIVIEAKQINTNLELKEEQLCDYLRVFSAEWGILTNGEEFTVYSRTGEADMPMKIAEIGIEDLTHSDILGSLQRHSYYEGHN